MKLDLNLSADGVNAGTPALAAEERGYSCAWVSETKHDSLITAALAAVATERISLGTAITVAFARSPMVTATAANDVQLASHGRLLLGLGSQVRAHITNRFSMPWSSPAPRMREYISALAAIWASWNDEAPLDFRGDFYTHTLMTPTFSPGPNPYGPPPVFLAAVGELMTEVAGEVADGMLCHAFTTERYIREVTLPALRRGSDRAGRAAESIELFLVPFVVTGTTEEEFARSAADIRQRIAFYGSTPSYRPVLELHGWGELQTELRTMSKAGKWREMGELIDDDMLNAFAVVGEPEQLADLITTRYGDFTDRMCLPELEGDSAALEPAIEALLAKQT